MPKAEIVLWSKLKNKQLNGIKFRRQYGIKGFVVDFYSPEFHLVIEVDGPTHEQSQERDAIRDNFIKSLGLKIVRINNLDVYKNLDSVINYILNNCIKE